jgi:plastocyanin
MERSTHLATLLCLCVISAQASEVHGEITLDTRMVKKAVPPGVYDLRGMSPHEKHAATTSSGTFGRVAVWLEGGADSAAPVTSTMQQRDRRFEPDLLIVPQGSKVLFPNLDPVFHNIFSLSRTQSFDLGYYAEGKSREVVFSRSGIIQVYCHVHPEMYGVIVVTSSRWIARPAPDGTFSFSDVPPGKYQVVVWQRAAGLIHKNIFVRSDVDAQVSFTLPDDEADR